MRSLALRGLIAGAFLASAAWGLDPATPLESYDARGWGYSEGLPQAPVSAVAPSRDGYLWLGTRSGLTRFDGVRFTLVEGKGGVQALAAGEDGWMWAGFLDGRLAGWRKGQRRALREARPGEGVLSLLWSAPDTLWIGTENGLARWRGGRVEAVPVTGCGTGCRVTALARGVDGALWIGTHNYGVRRLGGTGPAALTHVDGLPDDRVEALARADARDLAFVAHGLKGSSAQLGLARVAALSFEVERGAGTDLSLVPPLLSALESELACVAPLLAERQEREGLRREITPLAGGGESGPPTPRR